MIDAISLDAHWRCEYFEDDPDEVEFASGFGPLPIDEGGTLDQGAMFPESVRGRRSRERLSPARVEPRSQPRLRRLQGQS